MSAMEACERAGLAILGPTEGPGFEDGVMVAHGLGSPKLAPLEREGLRLTPCGSKHTLVREA